MSIVCKNYKITTEFASSKIINFLTQKHEGNDKDHGIAKVLSLKYSYTFFYSCSENNLSKCDNHASTAFDHLMGQNT